MPPEPRWKDVMVEQFHLWYIQSVGLLPDEYEFWMHCCFLPVIIFSNNAFVIVWQYHGVIPNGFLLTSVRTRTHEAPSKQSFIVLWVIDSKWDCGQGWRGKRKHTDLQSWKSGQIHIVLLDGKITQRKCLEAKGGRKEKRKKGNTERELVIPHKIFKLYYRISFSCSGSLLERMSS